MRFTGLLHAVCASLLVLMTLAIPVGAQDKEPGGNLVAVVFDATYEADCRHTTQENDGPVIEETCPPGSVIWSIPMEEGEALAKGFATYVVLTGNEKSDNAAIFDAMVAVHEAAIALASTSGIRALAASLPAALSCTAASVTKSGSYVNPNSGGRTYYVFGYRRNSNCSTDQGWDYARTTATATIRWDLSCVASGSGCRSRYITLTSSWSGTYGINNSYVGNYYGHYSTCTAGCGSLSTGVQAFGYQQFT